MTSPITIVNNNCERALSVGSHDHNTYDHAASSDDEKLDTFCNHNGGSDDHKNDDLGNSDATPDLEDTLFMITQRLARLRNMKDEMESFENNCTLMKQQVQHIAADLIAKIEDHAQRLREEIETRRETEMKKNEVSMTDLKTYIDELEEHEVHAYELLNKGDTDQMVEFTKNVQSHPCFTVTNLLYWLEEDENDDNEFVMPSLSIIPVRCNTAFGSIEDVCVDNSGQYHIRERSVSVMAPHRSASSSTYASSPTASPRTPTRSLSRSYKTSASTSPIITTTTAQGNLSPLAANTRSRTPSRRESSSTPSPRFDNLLGIDVHGQSGLRRANSARESKFNRTGSVADKVSLKARRTYSVKEGSHALIHAPKLLWEMTLEGNKIGEIQCPASIDCFTNGDVVVADNQYVQMFSSKDGKFLTAIGERRVKPRRLCVTADGDIAITDTKEDCVKVFNRHDQCVTMWGKKRFKSLFKSPCAIAMNSKGQYIVSDIEKRAIAIYSNEGKLIRQLKSNAVSHIHTPFYLTTDHNDRIIISDNGSHSIKVFDRNGEFLFQFNQINDEFEDLKFPNGVCTDSHGNILVADWGNHGVALYSPDGIFKKYLLTRSDRINHPADICLHGNSELIVCEYSDDHSAIRKFKIPAY